MWLEVIQGWCALLNRSWTPTFWLQVPWFETHKHTNFLFLRLTTYHKKMLGKLWTWFFLHSKRKPIALHPRCWVQWCMSPGMFFQGTNHLHVISLSHHVSIRCMSWTRMHLLKGIPQSKHRWGCGWDSGCCFFDVRGKLRHGKRSIHCKRRALAFPINVEGLPCFRTTSDKKEHETKLLHRFLFA